MGHESEVRIGSIDVREKVTTFNLDHLADDAIEILENPPELEEVFKCKMELNIFIDRYLEEIIEIPGGLGNYQRNKTWVTIFELFRAQIIRDDSSIALCGEEGIPVTLAEVCFGASLRE